MNNLKLLPASTADFTEIREGNLIYVDKTEYLYPMLQRGKPKYFLRRPRRFGKSLTVSTLEALLQGKKNLFEGLWIYDKWDWTPYSVVRFDFSRVSRFKNDEELTNNINDIIVYIGKSNSVLLNKTSNWSSNLTTLLSELKLRGPVAVLIDEYDNPFHKALDWSEEQQKVTLDVFRDFYGILKSLEDNYNFMFITGITKIAKTSVFSGMNSLEDISLEPQFAGMCGITQTELESAFTCHIDYMVTETNCTRNELLADLKSMYNGYRFSPDSDTCVYNPFSLNHALKHMKPGKFWFQSGTPTLLINLIKKNNYDLSFLNDLNTTHDEMNSSYEFSSITLKNLLYETGYLTIQEDPSVHEKPRSRYLTNFSLNFPNEEIRVAFANSILDSLRGKPTSDKEMKLGDKLVETLKGGRWEDFKEIWNELLSHIPYNLHIPLESYYHSLFVLFAMVYGFDVQAERKSSVGRIDMAVELSDKIYIIEFKLNASAADALKQINEKRYFEVYKVKNKPIFLIGISFDSKLKQIVEVQLEDLQLKKIEKII